MNCTENQQQHWHNPEHLLQVNPIWGCRHNKMIQFLSYGTTIIIIMSTGQLNGPLQLATIICIWAYSSWRSTPTSINCVWKNRINCLRKSQQVRMMSSWQIWYGRYPFSIDILFLGRLCPGHPPLPRPPCSPRLLPWTPRLPSPISNALTLAYALLSPDSIYPLPTTTPPSTLHTPLTLPSTNTTSTISRGRKFLSTPPNDIVN